MNEVCRSSWIRLVHDIPFHCHLSFPHLEYGWIGSGLDL